MAAMPIKYADGATKDDPLKNAPVIRAITGSFAPQGMKLVVMMVILLSLSFSIVLEAIIPGTLHPVPINIGMKDLPDRPNFLKILSITKATLAMYPHPSKNARNKNNTNI